MTSQECTLHCSSNRVEPFFYRNGKISFNLSCCWETREWRWWKKFASVTEWPLMRWRVVVNIELREMGGEKSEIENDSEENVRFSFFPRSKESWKGTWKYCYFVSWLNCNARYENIVGRFSSCRYFEKMLDLRVCHSPYMYYGKRHSLVFRKLSTVKWCKHLQACLRNCTTNVIKKGVEILDCSNNRR